MEHVTAQPNHPTALSIPQRRRDIEEIDIAISKISRGINSANYDLMVLIREFDERAGWLMRL